MPWRCHVPACSAAAVSRFATLCLRSSAHTYALPLLFYSVPTYAVALSLCVSRCLCYSVPYLAAARLAPLRLSIAQQFTSMLCHCSAPQSVHCHCLAVLRFSSPLRRPVLLRHQYIAFALLSSTEPLLFCAIRPVLFPTSPLQFLSMPGLAFASRCMSLLYRLSALFAVQCLCLPSLI